MKEPSALAMAHSAQLSALIRAKIKTQNGCISFAEFMQQALYAPGLGYYNSGTQKFGGNGDFVTAPEIGSLFAKCVAQQCAQILSALVAPTILEIGAGSGRLACDLILSLAQQNIKLDRYLILELSADLRQRQQQLLQQNCPDFFENIQWLDHLPESINGVIIANEVMDAMPVSRFQWHNNTLQEYYVTTHPHNFSYVLQEPTPQLLHAFAAANIALYLETIAEPYSSEINLWLNAWIHSLADCLQQGAILLFDYGFGRAEYYHPQRDTGTLMCHYQHHCHADPFYYPGLQDITAHVDFTAVAEAADASNLQVTGFTNLAGFLINCGITNFFDQTPANSHELNLLTSPAEMGELFKAMILTKDIAVEMVGFDSYDKLHTL